MNFFVSFTEAEIAEVFRLFSVHKFTSMIPKEVSLYVNK